MRYTSQVRPISHLKANATEMLALLKILALGNQEIDAGKLKPATKVIVQLRAKRAAD